MSTIKVDTYLTRGGASEIAIDKLKGASSASSISVVAEGGTNTTNLQQGLVKCWSHFNGTGTVAITDSFNQGSLTDVGTGNYMVVMTNNMSTSAGFATSKGDDSRGAGECRPNSTTGISIICRILDGTSAAGDDARVSGLAAGDLA